jgi:dTDP-4-dehydrorhamnose reductase
MANLLLTGGSGLLALNWTRIMAGTWTVHRLEHRRRLQVPGSQSHMGSLEAVDSVSRLLDLTKPDLVVNCAGMTNVEECQADPAAAQRANAEMPGLLAAACTSRGVRFVHISTDHLFDDRRTLFSESDRPAPLNVYGSTKAAGERAVFDAAPEALVIRTNFFGWGTSYRRSFTDSILSALRGGVRPMLFDDVYFTPILIDRLVEVVHQLVDLQGSGLYHVVGDERLTKYDFGLLVAREFGLDETLVQRGRFADRPELAARPREMGLSNAKLRSAIGCAIGDVATQLEHLAALETMAGVKEIQQL